MKWPAVIIAYFAGRSNAAFVPYISKTGRSSMVVIRGYLDDLSKDLYKSEEETYNPETDSREANEKARDQIDRYGPGNWQDYVDFDEFDGGDGQMGVAGDGNKGLDKIGSQPTLARSMEKSKMMSAKNAWGTSTGYADELLKQNPQMDTARAQQLENWRNQREVHSKNKYVQEMEQADSSRREDVDWRQLAKFGVERNDDFDLNEAFGAVAAGDAIEETIELHSLMGKPQIHILNVKNEYMGFADFRAAFTPDSSSDFSVSPTEGSLQREPTEFVVNFKPSNPAACEGTLVIETEDFKKTWKFIGSTA